MSRSSTVVTYSELGEEVRCVERPPYVCQTEPPSLLTRDAPLHSVDGSQPACWIWPLKITCCTSSLPNKTIFFPFRLAKPGLKITGEISQDFSCISNSEQLKKSWGWGMKLYCRPLKSWYTLEGEHCPTAEWLLAPGRQWKTRYQGQSKEKEQRKKKTKGDISLASKGRAVDFQ